MEWPLEEPGKGSRHAASLEASMPEHQPRHQIAIHGVPAERTKFIKALRLAGQLDLKQASDLAAHFDRVRHSILVAGIDLPVAEHLAEELREAGADVEIQPSSITTPMLCSPQVNEKYVWGAARTLKRAV